MPRSRIGAKRRLEIASTTAATALSWSGRRRNWGSPAARGPEPPMEPKGTVDAGGEDEPGAGDTPSEAETPRAPGAASAVAPVAGVAARDGRRWRSSESRSTWGNRRSTPGETRRVNTPAVQPAAAITSAAVAGRPTA